MILQARASHAERRSPRPRLPARRPDCLLRSWRPRSGRREPRWSPCGRLIRGAAPSVCGPGVAPGYAQIARKWLWPASLSPTPAIARRLPW